MGAGETEEAVQIPMKFTVADAIAYIRTVAVADVNGKKALLHISDRIYVTQVHECRSLLVYVQHHTWFRP